MKPFDWNYDKNAILLAERGRSFDEVVVLIRDGKLLDVLTHSNSDQYPGQKIYVFDIE